MLSWTDILAVAALVGMAIYAIRTRQPDDNNRRLDRW